jgi:serine protease inhibitor
MYTLIRKHRNWPITAILLFVFILFLSPSCSEDNVVENETPENRVKFAIISSNNSFSFDVFKEIIKNDPVDENIFISPLSMYYALAMAGNGASDHTYNEFSEVLGWENRNKEDVLLFMKELLEELIPQEEDVVVEIANSIWSREDFPVKELYIQETEDYFNAKATTLDFTDPASLDIINSWIEEKTHGKITNMIEQLSPDAVVYLINAIYFNGIWKYQFEDTLNFDAPFTKTDGTREDVTYMKQTAPLKFYRHTNFSAVQLPYVDSNYTMTIYLPDNNYSTSDLAMELGPENWKNWADLFEYKEVVLELPKFKYSYGNRLLNNELIDLGLELAFDPNQADFSNITDAQIFISKVLHKAFVEVNEIGTEAAAVTVIEFEVTGIETNKIYFQVNKPFIYTITENKSGSILFMGRVAFPEYLNQ